MNTYAHRWQLAVALKQPYPRPETGAEDSTTSVTAAPPVFIPVESKPETNWGALAVVGTLGLAIGVFVGGIAAFHDASHGYG